MENQIKIDVAHVLKTRAPKTKVPRFVVNYLRRIVHEDEFNQFFSENPGLKNLDFIEAARLRDEMFALQNLLSEKKAKSNPK